MNLIELLEDFQTQIECEGDIEIIDDDIAQLLTTVIIGGQTFSLFIETNQEKQRIVINLFPDFVVQTGKLIDAIMLFNYLNYTYNYRGRVALRETSKASICYKTILDVNDIENLSVILLARVLADGIKFFERFSGIISDIAFTPKTFEAIQRDIETKGICG